jgi:hypothetical protein
LFKEMLDMTCRSIVKPVETRHGIGEVFVKNRLLARVSYNLDILQEEFWADPAEALSTEQNREWVVGNITLLDKGKKLQGTDIMTLRMRDSQRLDFGWQRSEIVNPRYMITSRGGIY